MKYWKTNYVSIPSHKSQIKPNHLVIQFLGLLRVRFYKEEFVAIILWEHICMYNFVQYNEIRCSHECTLYNHLWCKAKAVEEIFYKMGHQFCFLYLINLHYFYLKSPIEREIDMQVGKSHTYLNSAAAASMSTRHTGQQLQETHVGVSSFILR